MGNATATTSKSDQAAKDKKQTDAVLAACLAIVTLKAQTCHELAFNIFATVMSDLRRLVARKMDKDTKKRFDLLLKGCIDRARTADYKARATEGITSVIATLKKIKAVIDGETSEVRKQQYRDWLAYHLNIMPKKDRPEFKAAYRDGKVKSPVDKFEVDSLGWAVVRFVGGGPENSLIPRAVDDKVDRIIEECTPDWIADQLETVDLIAGHVAAIGRRNIPVGPKEDGVSVATSYEFIQLAGNLRETKAQWAASLSYAINQKLGN